MNINDALLKRSSIRHFENKVIPQGTLERVLNNALKSPSGGNAQPYRIAIASGSVKDQIKSELSEKFTSANEIQRLPLPQKIWQGFSKGVMPDGDFNPNVKYKGELKERKFACGMGLYETLGVGRSDRAGRNEQMKRNFEFFDAPTVIFIFVNAQLGHYSTLDAGIFMQSLMLSAVSEGLGTCPQAALAIWGSPIKRQFKVDKDYKLICGMSIGYPSEHIVNNYQPKKRDLESLCLEKI